MEGAAGKVKTFRDLLVWQKAIRLVTEIYGASQGWPKEETFGLKAQMRRAAVPIPSNIAEGVGGGRMMIICASCRLPWVRCLSC